MKALPIIILVFLILLSHSVSFADSGQQNTASLEACNTFYHNNAFEDAITCYKNLLSEVHSANILYNIGNSYAQLDQPGYSVLYFLRALSVNPKDSDISGNLAMIKKEKGLFPPEKSAVKMFFGLLTLGQWSILCLMSLAGYLVFSLTRLSKGKNRVLESLVILLCIFSLSAGALGTTMRYREWHQSVVIRDSRLLVSPFENGASIGSIKQGRLVHPHKEHGDYWYVTDETGRKGWLEREVFESILP
jgi:hypothetical protein